VIFLKPGLLFYWHRFRPNGFRLMVIKFEYHREHYTRQ